MNGRTCIVTGANAGIGKETTRALAAKGATVVMVCRSADKAQDAMDDIASTAPDADLRLLVADLSSLEQVRRLADEIGRTFERIDVLVNNAGVHMFHRETTCDGNERMLGVNHLAPFLLTNLLRDQLVASAPARVIAVASEAHRLGHTIDFDDLQAERLRPGLRWSFQTYGRTKLMNILFAADLADQLRGTGVTSNSLCPGLVATNLFAEARLLAAAAKSFQRTPFVRTPVQGAQMSVHLATDPALATTTGDFFSSTRLMRPVPPVRARGDLEMRGRLWRTSEELVGLR